MIPLKESAGAQILPFCVCSKGTIDSHNVSQSLFLFVLFLVHSRAVFLYRLFWILLLLFFFSFYIVCVTILSVEIRKLCVTGWNVALRGGWLPDCLCEMQCCEWICIYYMCMVCVFLYLYGVCVCVWQFNGRYFWCQCYFAYILDSHPENYLRSSVSAWEKSTIQNMVRNRNEIK